MDDDPKWMWYEKAAALCGAFLRFWRLPWNQKHAAMMLAYTLTDGVVDTDAVEYWEAKVVFDREDCGFVSVVGRDAKDKMVSLSSAPWQFKGPAFNGNNAVSQAEVRNGC